MTPMLAECLPYTFLLQGFLRQLGLESPVLSVCGAVARVD